MHRPATSGLLFSLLALWMQLFAPAAVMAMQQRSVDPFAVICSHSNDGSDGTSDHGHGGHAHDCCPLCQCHLLGTLLADNRPVFTVFDYPAASPLRWASVVEPTNVSSGRKRPPPRGPPVLV